ncbi:hypothetical protein C900_00425 [Fulvivirga imtechensis AK7]|uniref:Uncharacterized protein n=1 Tax=Fulvivirga imtechensis AK7 TaxID=1237149 RepID=L8JJH6_9BACT|nr:hypothetical protein C900_00425 [Fulvivirga imtechensis AK7]
MVALITLLASCLSNYETGIDHFNNNEYEEALTYLQKVETTDEKYELAQNKIKEIDSILTRNSVENARLDSIERAEAIQKELTRFKNQLKGEIESTNSFDGSTYRNSVTSVQMEIVLFGAWAKIINDAEKHSDKEINQLGKTLKRKVISIQKAEFPKLRKNYSEVLSQKLWTENIKVKTKGRGHSVLEFEGAIFANNKNKQDTQQTLSEALGLLRFKQVNYKWYKYDDEYTYYTLRTKADYEMVDFQN